MECPSLSSLIDPSIDFHVPQPVHELATSAMASGLLSLQPPSPLDFDDTTDTSDSTSATISALNSINATSEPWEEAMRAQLATWFEDPDFVDEVPSMDVVPGDKGVGLILDGDAIVALPPDAVFSMLCNAHNRRVYRNVKAAKNERVVSDCNGVKVCEMDFTLTFRLPPFTGTFDSHLLFVYDRPKRRVTFTQTRPGFMRKFEGYWQVESLLVPSSAPLSSSPSSSPSSPSRPTSPTSSAPSPPIGTFGSSPQSPLSEVCGGQCDRDWSADFAGAFAASAGSGYRVASRLVLHQFVLPPIAPPNIFKRCLRALLRESTRDLLVVFQEEAARIRRNKGKEEAEEKGKAGKSSKLGLGASIARSTPAVRNPFEYPSATSPAIKATSAAMNTSATSIPTASEPWEEAISSQLAAWFDDSHWTDKPPSMTVTVGDHGRGQLDGVATVALPPDTVFSILCDPHNRRVFTFIKSVKNERVVSDCNGVREVELDIVFALKVPFFTGTFDAHLRNVHDRPNRRVTFCLSRPGFMRKFEGYWQVDPLLVPASATYATSPSSAASAASAAPSASDVPSFLSAEGDPESELFPSVSFTPQSPLSDVMFLGSSCDSNSESGSDLNSSGSDSSNSASSSPDRFPARVIPDPTTTTSVGSLCGSGGGLGGDDTRGSGRLGEDSGLGADSGLGGDGGLGGDAGMRVASRLALHQVVEPSLAPPPMFRRCVHALLKAATRDVLVVFQYEAARIRNSKGKFPWRNGAEAGAEEGEEEGKGKAGKSSKLGAMFLHKEALGGKNSVFGVGKGGFGLKKPAQRKA
ncbi:unnamed protein product [Closterium sp. NIES-65]|nr:unnamed protein product [Closterium sp. NIES-65]